MTIKISTAKRASLDANGSANNPVIAWDNLIYDAAMSTDTGTETESAAYLQTGSTYDPWAATPSSGNIVVSADMGAAQRISFAAIAYHNLAAVGASIAFEVSTDGGSTWADCGCGAVTPTDKQAIGFYFVDHDATDVRLSITGATDEVYIGALFVCDPIISPRRIYRGYAPPITPNSVQLQTNVSGGNHLLGSAIVSTGSSATANLQNLPADFVRGADWVAFQKHFNTGNGFFWAWRPAKYGDLFFAWRGGNVIAPPNDGPNGLVSASIEMSFHDEQ